MGTTVGNGLFKETIGFNQGGLWNWIWCNHEKNLDFFVTFTKILCGSDTEVKFVMIIFYRQIV